MTPFLILDQNTVRIVTSLILCSAALSLGACSGSTEPPRADETISREAFVQAYYQLRREALRSPLMEIGLPARDSILSDLQLTDTELIFYAEVWGGEGEVMEAIWEEVDSLLRGDRTSGRGAAGSEGEDDPEEEGMDSRGVGRP